MRLQLIFLRGKKMFFLDLKIENHSYVPVSSDGEGDPIPDEDPIDGIAVGTKKGPPFSGFVVY